MKRHSPGNLRTALRSKPYMQYFKTSTPDQRHNGRRLMAATIYVPLYCFVSLVFSHRSASSPITGGGHAKCTRQWRPGGPGSTTGADFDRSKLQWRTMRQYTKASAEFLCFHSIPI